MITKIFIRNYRTFESFSLDCNPELNILVGDNDAGKSTILEAIHLCLTRRLNGRVIESELTSALFNASIVSRYLKGIHSGVPTELPRIVIELSFVDDNAHMHLRGTNNEDGADCPGLRLEMAFDDEYAVEYEKALEVPNDVQAIPTEYYRVTWLSFASNPVTVRSVPIRTSMIDATSIRLQSGTDHYLSTIINSGLDPKDRVGLAIAYRRLKELFSAEPAMQEINTRFSTERGALRESNLTFAMDLSQRGSWETSLVPHLDTIPYGLVGKGEQNALKILLALNRSASESHVVLVEEPENHLSFASMNLLISKMLTRCIGKQLFVSTHSAYVLNSLGVDKVILLSGGRPTFLKSLSVGTQNYFRKLTGYDTLRLILARKTILVEGPSDELLVQKAYLQQHHKLPINDGVDVVNVRGLSFPRFLEIARLLSKITVVVTDNDGDFDANVRLRYLPFAGAPQIRICADPTNALPTLENHLLQNNGREALNRILGKSYSDDDALLKYMTKNKSECALRIFDCTESVVIPQYIQDAIA